TISVPMPWTTGALPQRDPVTELRRRVPKYLVVPARVEMDAANRSLRTANLTGIRQGSRPSGSELGQDYLGDRGRQFRGLVLAGRDRLERPAAAPEHDCGIETVRPADGHARLIADAAQRLALGCQPALIADREHVEEDKETGAGRASGILIMAP